MKLVLGLASEPGCEVSSHWPQLLPAVAVQAGKAREAELGAQLAVSAEKLSVKERELAEARQLVQVRQANVDIGHYIMCRTVPVISSASLCHIQVAHIAP